jgi:hypothetical protein
MLARLVTKMLTSGDPGEQVDDGEPARQREPGDQQRQRGPHERPEDGEQDDRGDRQADQLRLDEVLLDLLVDLVVELRDAGDGDRDAIRRFDPLAQLRGALDGVLLRLGERDDRQRLRAVLAEQLLDRRVGVGRDLVHQRLVGDRLERLGDGLLEGR